MINDKYLQRSSVTNDIKTIQKKTRIIQKISDQENLKIVSPSIYY